MDKLSLKAAKNRQLDLKTKIQAVKDPTLREQLTEMLKEINLREATDAEFEQIEEGLKAAATMPADSPVPAPERQATPADIEAAKANLESGGAQPAPETPKAKAPPRKRGAATSADRFTYQPNTPGVFAYVRGTKPGANGETQVVSIVLNGSDQADLIRVAKDYMKKEGISPGGEVPGQPGVFKNIYIQSIPNPTEGNFEPVDARNLADSHEANYRVARNDALAKVREARRSGKTEEEIKKLDQAVPPALQTVSETETYEARDQARKEARGKRRSQKRAEDTTLSTQERNIQLLEQESRDAGYNQVDKYLAKAGGTPATSARPMTDTERNSAAAIAEGKGQTFSGTVSERTGAWSFEDGTYISKEQRDLLAKRLALSQAEIDALNPAEQAAFAKMRQQLEFGNFKEALQSAQAIPAGSVEKVMRGNKPVNVPEQARPTVTKDKWSDPPELEKKLQSAGFKPNSKSPKAREIRVQHMFETGVFNVMGDDRTSWIDDNPEGWAKIRSNANAMDYLEVVGKNRDVAMTKVTADTFEAGVLKPLNVAIGRMGEPGADVTKNIVSLAERTKGQFFRNGQLKKGMSSVDKQVAQSIGKEQTFGRSRNQERLAYMDSLGWTEESLEKKIGNYREEMSKKREKGALDSKQESDYNRLIRQAEADKALMATRRELRLANEKALASGGRIAAVPYRTTKRNFEDQLAAVETKITRLKSGYHPDKVHGPGPNEGKPKRISYLKKDKEGNVFLTEGLKKKLAGLEKFRDDLKARIASQGITEASPEGARVLNPAPTKMTVEPAAPSITTTAADEVLGGKAAAETAAVAAATPAAEAAAGLPNPYKKGVKGKGWKANPARAENLKQLKTRAASMLPGRGALSTIGRYVGPLFGIWGAYELLNLVKEGTIDEADARRLKAMQALGAVGGGMQQDLQINDQIRQMQKMVDLAAVQRQQKLDDMKNQYTGNQALDSLLRGQQASLAALAQPSRPSIAEMMARM